MKPCHNCPFLRKRAGVEPVLLMRARRREIATALRRGGAFPCHKTVHHADDDDERDDIADAKRRGRELFCGGALATMDNDGMDDAGNGCMANQMVRIMSRIGQCNPDKVQGRDDVYKSLDEWVVKAKSV